MENIGKFMTIVLAMLIALIINGFVIMKLWLWFVVPIFGSRPLRLVETIGLIILIRHIGAKRYKKFNEDDFWKRFGMNMAYLLLLSGFALLTGWVTQLFI